MKLLFKQRLFSWLDSYDIYDEEGAKAYSVEGKLSWGHRLHIYDRAGGHVGTVQERVLAFFPTYEVEELGRYIGRIRKKFSILLPRFDFEYSGWQVEGNFLEWDYRIVGSGGELIATITKELLHLSDTYILNVVRQTDVLRVVMMILAIDAAKCSHRR